MEQQLLILSEGGGYRLSRITEHALLFKERTEVLPGTLRPPKRGMNSPNPPPPAYLAVETMKAQLLYFFFLCPNQIQRRGKGKSAATLLMWVSEKLAKNEKPAFCTERTHPSFKLGVPDFQNADSGIKNRFYGILER